MKRLLYILILAIFANGCTSELRETESERADLEGKVLIDFSVHLSDVPPSTKALTEKPAPALKNLMVAVFDAENYLVEHTFASEETVLAKENGTKYIYKVALTQSKDKRIIHFIGNAPEDLRFGTEETVLSYVKSELGTANEDLYWYRREVPSISGINQTVEPVYQATPDTKAAFDNIPLIRNFARISLANAAPSDFELESWTVVNTYKTGTCAAYNTSIGKFVEYFHYVDSQNSALQELGIKELGEPKILDSLLVRENYKGNIPANVKKVSVQEAKPSLQNRDYYYAYERDVTSDPAYIIAYGTYKGDGKNNKCYYKIGLYDNNGKSFPLLRNFQYSLTITKVERAGYDSFEEAATSTGSGNISTAQETMSLVYISDGVASLSVDYTEKMIVEDGVVDLGFDFISDVTTNTKGSLSNVRVFVNKPDGTAGAAIAKVNNADYKVDEIIKPTDWTLEITPVTPSSVSKKQSLTIYADYIDPDTDQTITLQRTVTYIVWEKQRLEVECVPGEIPAERGSELNVHITIPGGLSSSMFPLELKIEAEKLSITPNNEKDHMPVQSGNSIINSSKSAFYFIKTVQWEEYQVSKLVTCHFKSNKDESDSNVYVANDYFITASDNFITYTPSHFDNLKFTPDKVACLEGETVNFSFTMDGTWDQPVTVYLGGLQPHEDDPNGLVATGKVVDNKAEYIFTPTSENGGANVTLKLQTTDEDTQLYVGLESHRYVSNHETADRDWMEFTNLSISPNRLLQGVGRTATISFRMDTGDADYANRDVTVKLNGLEFANGKSEFTFKPVTSGNVTVTVNNNVRTVTISGLKTTTERDAVSFTVSASGYNSNTQNKTRSGGSFSNLSFSQKGSTVTSLSTSSQEVDFNFTLSDYDENMEITVTLDGFEVVDANSVATRAVNYTYKPSGTNCTIKLRTADVSENTLCKVTLSEPYFTEASLSIQQSDTVVIPAGYLNVGSGNYTYYIYTSNPGKNNNVTAIGSFVAYRASRWDDYANQYDITLMNISTDTIYIRYTTGNNYNRKYYVATVKLADVTQKEVELDFKQQ